MLLFGRIKRRLSLYCSCDDAANRLTIQDYFHARERTKVSYQKDKTRPKFCSNVLFTCEHLSVSVRFARRGKAAFCDLIRVAQVPGKKRALLTFLSGHNPKQNCWVRERDRKKNLSTSLCTAKHHVSSFIASLFFVRALGGRRENKEQMPANVSFLFRGKLKKTTH